MPPPRTFAADLRAAARARRRLQDAMSGGLAYVRWFYGVPAFRGSAVTFCGRRGVIVGARRQYIRVRPDDGGRILTCHATWEVEYAPPTRGKRHSPPAREVADGSASPRGDVVRETKEMVGLGSTAVDPHSEVAMPGRRRAR